MENSAMSINEQQLKGNEDINAKVLVDILNEYVETKNKINDIQLTKWKSEGQYPKFE